MLAESCRIPASVWRATYLGLGESDVPSTTFRISVPALLLWGRHDIFFDCAEILSWLQDLPRMEAHVLDGPHLLLETHAAYCAELIVDFVRRSKPS